MKYVTYSNSRMVLTSIIFFFNDFSVLSERGVEKERERQKRWRGGERKRWRGGGRKRWRGGERENESSVLC